MSYFSNFPLTEYNGVLCKNITSRVALSAKSRLDASVFYPYGISESDRPETLAYDYYGQPDDDWLLLIANDIIDPYYGWYLSSEQFDEYMKKKYGSLADAQERIDYFRVNYRTDSTILSVSGYNALPSTRKMYWVPVLNDLGSIAGYKRKVLDITARTNKTVMLTVDSTEGFIVNERIRQYSGLTLAASAQIASIVDEETLLVEKLGDGDFDEADIVGGLSDTTATVAAVNLINEAISSDVYVYWEPVTYYTSEFEKNESRRSIKVINNSYTEFVNSEVSRLLNE